MNEVTNRTNRPEIQSQSDSDETPKTKLETNTVIIDSIVWETSRGNQFGGFESPFLPVEFVVKSPLFSDEMDDEIYELLEKEFVTPNFPVTPVSYSLDVLRMKEEVSV